MANSSDIFPRERKTKLPGGYMGKILRVDLTSGSMQDENLPEEPVLRQFIGGQALATYILLKELPLNPPAQGRLDASYYKGLGISAASGQNLSETLRRLGLIDAGGKLSEIGRSLTGGDTSGKALARLVSGEGTIRYQGQDIGGWASHRWGKGTHASPHAGRSALQDPGMALQRRRHRLPIIAILR